MNSNFLGFGLGLRTDHFADVIKQQPSVDWFEVLSENFMVDGGKPKHYLHRIRQDYPMTMHGVALSIGSTDQLDKQYLGKLKALAAEIEPAWISDHLCWTGVGGVNSHDLLPLPYSEEAIAHVVDRVIQVQYYLGQQILMENVSSYLTYQESALPEWEFLAEVAGRADCLILLDINNIYVSARNHGFDPLDYINAIDPARVQQIHLAGHSDYGDYVIDTHDHEVADAVWDLYRQSIERFGPVSSMIERDDHIPPLPVLVDELQIARDLVDSVVLAEPQGVTA